MVSGHLYGPVQPATPARRPLMQRAVQGIDREWERERKRQETMAARAERVEEEEWARRAKEDAEKVAIAERLTPWWRDFFRCTYEGGNNDQSAENAPPEPPPRFQFNAGRRFAIASGAPPTSVLGARPMR